MDSDCDHMGGKLTAKSLLVMQAIYDHANGIQSYPLAGNLNSQPQWFSIMFRQGLSAMHKAQVDNMERKAKMAGKK